MFGNHLIKPENIMAIFKGNMDFKKRVLRVADKTCMIFFIEGMVDSTALSRFIIEPLKNTQDIEQSLDVGEISFCDIEKADEEKSVISGILRGKAALLIKGKGYLFDVRKVEKRSVEQPSEENAVKASKDSFVEELKINSTLLRKKIVSENLVIEKTEAGRQTHTVIAVIYMRNIANTKLIEEVKNKLDRINVDGVLGPAIVEQAVTENLASFFPQAVITERPDKVCDSLLKGRVAVLVDGIPLGYILPATLNQFMSTPEDYSGNFVFASVVRMLRYFLLGMEVLLPGAYVALTTFHYEMIPAKLALSIAQAKMGVPFPVIFEVLAMLALFEVLIEAGLHMPQSSGQAVSIVGALVVGEAAISADLVSPAALIIVAISAISSFAMPNQEFGNALRLWRVIITVLGSALGLFGVVAGGIVLLAHLAGLESFGVPYLAPLAGVRMPKIKDTLVIVPDKYNVNRPQELKVKNKRRAR